MNFEKNKNYITLEGTMYEVNFCNLTNRIDDGYNVNFYDYNDIMRNRGLVKDLLHYCKSLSVLHDELLKNGLQLKLLESVDNINIFSITYITKNEVENYKRMDFVKMFNDKR